MGRSFLVCVLCVALWSVPSLSYADQLDTVLDELIKSREVELNKKKHEGTPPEFSSRAIVAPQHIANRARVLDFAKAGPARQKSRARHAQAASSRLNPIPTK